MAGFPSLSAFFPPTPEAYAFQLRVFQYFPVVTITQWFSSYHPAGKTSLPKSRLNIPGRIAWSLMELVGPVHLLYILFTLPPQVVHLTLASLPLWHKIVAGLYVVHYFNRAIVNPLFVAPSISPVRADIFLSAVVYNWFNSSCLGGWIVGYANNVEGFSFKTDRPAAPSLSLVQCLLPYIGLVLFALGMMGNIRAERTLWRLRREEAHRRAVAAAAAAEKKDDANAQTKKNPYSKVYVIPPARGLFRWILYPHYVCEWLEWLGYVLVGTAVYPSNISSTASTSTAYGATTPTIRLAPWLVPFAALAEKLQLPLPLPALVFAVNNILTMLPQARRGRQWYVERFGKDAVGGRAAAVPGVPFL
ncbi:hypothetical protein VTN77DRAFT_1212 [Rasamsonia byssochlamydoides]|uniref:uncharacterized protein n=1 Tax=Rasamsonia byssochlamydoides TaxID=89139 RepID=UPI0037425894